MPADKRLRGKGIGKGKGKGSQDTQFKPGQVPNPNGRPKKDPITINFTKTTYKDFLNKLQMFGSMSAQELEDVIQDKTHMAFDILFARIIYDAMNGRADARQVLLERLWGKVKEVEHTEEISEEEALMKKIPVQELVELARKYKAA